MPEFDFVPAAASEPDLESLPRRVDRRDAAALVTRFYFKVSPRSLERWPLRWRLLNGKAFAETAELVAEARARLEAAPVIRGSSLSSEHASHLAA